MDRVTRQGVLPVIVTRRTFLRRSAAVATATAISSCAIASPAAKPIPRVGVLSLQLAPASNSGLAESLLAGLSGLGYEAGKNIEVAFRWNDNPDPEARGARAVAELLRFPVEIIVAYGNVAQRSAKAATSMIPIVIFAGTDPVETGLVQNLARPGGNITGVAGDAAKIGAKNLELLKESFPSISRVAIVTDQDPERKLKRRHVEDAAHALGLETIAVEARTADDVPAALAATASRPPDGLLVFSLWGSTNERAFATAHRLPAIYATQISVDNGGLMTYVEDHHDMARRAAAYVIRILSGEKPADMAIEQPTKFAFVVNLKTAREQGLTIPQSVLTRATRVIE